MKKVMFAAAVAASMVAFGEITSQNIVGYQQTSIKNSGYNFIIPTFVDVASQTAQYNLDNVKLIGAQGDEWSEQIIGYDETANLDGHTYLYCIPGAASYAEEGWYENGEKITTVKMPVGTGLYFYCEDSSVKVQYAGQVYGEAITNNIQAVGYNMIGNATPTAIDLQDIKLVGAQGDEWSEQIIGYDETANLDGHTYLYCIPGAASYAEEGWYENGEKVTGITLEPGEGVYLYCEDTNVKFTLPSAVK